MKHVFSCIFFIALLFSFGCKSAKVTPVPVRTVERVTERLVPVEVPGDSALLTALLYCDSLNRVRIAEISELKSKRMETSFSLKNGTLAYKAATKPDTVYLPSKTTEIEKEVPVLVEVPVTEYKQTKVQRFFFYLGIFATASVALWLGIKLKAGNILNIIFKLFKRQ